MSNIDASSFQAPRATNEMVRALATQIAAAEGGDVANIEQTQELDGSELGVSPDAIMSLLQIRMRDFDTEISARLDEIRTYQTKSKALSDKLSLLNQYQTTFVDQTGGINRSRTYSPDADLVPGLLASVEARIAALGADAPMSRTDMVRGIAGSITGETKTVKLEKGLLSDLADKLRQPSPQLTHAEYRLLHADALEKVPEDGKASDVLGPHISKLKDDLQTLNTGNDLRMTQLQSTLQQRTALIQMGSNLLKSLDEANKAIISNMR